jgi:hypothetical protein
MVEGYFSMPGDFARVAKECVDTSHKLYSVVHTLDLFLFSQISNCVSWLNKKKLSKDEKTL